MQGEKRMTTSKRNRRPSLKSKPKAGANLPISILRQSASFGTLADVFPTELTSLIQTGRQVVSEIKEMSAKELDAITQAGKQKGQVTAGTQQTIQMLIEKLPEILESETEQDRGERLRLVTDLIDVIDNVDHRDHQFRTQQAQLLHQQQGDATLKVLAALALAALGALGAAALLSKRE
jgi:hypothetical protein